MGRTKPEVAEALEKFKKAVKKLGVEKLVLFGSQTTGSAGEASDVDLIVVSREKDKLGLLSKLYHEWHMVHGIDLPVDFICYTPEEFEKLGNRVTIVSEAIRNGIVIEIE